ncbi:F-box only protein 47-like isoform X2 [Ptychodera flava]
MRSLVEDFRLTGSGIKKLRPVPLPHNKVSANHQARYVQHFQHLGLLMKRSTCLFATNYRLKKIEEFLQKLDCLSNVMCGDLNSCISLTCYGKFLHTVIAGWDNVECRRAFAAVVTTSSILHKIGTCVAAQPGTDHRQEIFVRTFLHRVLLDQCNSLEQRVFWLTCVMKPCPVEPWPIVHQARLLYLLYGPLCPQTGKILWYEMTDLGTGSTMATMTQLAELALALKTLHIYDSEWTEDDVVSVIEEITALPAQWTPENIARLLMLCGDDIAIKVMGSKAINGHFQELAGLIVALTVVSVKEQNHMLWVVQIMKTLLRLIDNVTSRKVLLSLVSETYKDMILDFFEFHLDDSDIDASLESTLEAQAEFNKYVMHMAYTEVL